MAYSLNLSSWHINRRSCPNDFSRVCHLNWESNIMNFADTQIVVQCLIGLRSAVGGRGKWSAGRRAAYSESQPERNAPPPSHRRKPAVLAATLPMPLVTSARFARTTGKVERGTGTTFSPWSEASRALVTADSSYVSQRGWLPVPSQHLIHPSWRRLFERRDGWICEVP